MKKGSGVSLTAPRIVPREGPLRGLRVIDATDALAAYAARLLGDLGADVIRVEPVGGSPTRRMGPLARAADGSDVSLFDRFVNAGKRSVTLDLDHVDGRVMFHRLLATADVLLETFTARRAEVLRLTPPETAALYPRLVHVSVTAFGRDRTPDDVADDDLTIMAAGGLLHLGGYPDTGPVVAYGGQGQVAASLFAAVGSLVALLARERSGAGDWIDVSAQECVAQALEDTVPTFEMTGKVRRRVGPDSREAGTGMYGCRDGTVSMVAGRVGTAKAWRTLVDWLIEEHVDGASDLLGPAWSEITYRQTDAAIARFGELFGWFASTRSMAELYEEAQHRGIALSPVNDVRAVLDDPQLKARGFWVEVHDQKLGRSAIFPGPPYRLSATPASGARPAHELGSDTRAVLVHELGLLDGQVDALVEAGAA